MRDFTTRASATLALSLILALGPACGGDSGDDPTIPPLESPQPTRTTAPATQAPTQETPPASPTPAPEGGADHPATAVALEVVGGRYLSPLTRDGCIEDNPESMPCIELLSDAETLGAGIARFRGGYPDGGLFDLVMAETSAGEWGFWYATEAGAYLLVNLPGELLACGTAGGSLTVTAEPDGGAEVGTVERLEPLSADSFVLVSEGTYGVSGQRGEGAYHITAPYDGWVDAHQTADAANGDCSLRDAFEGDLQHG